MPTPNKGESQSEYIPRCVAYVMKNGEAKDNKQAAAICYSKWKSSKSSEASAKALVTAMTGRCSQCGGKTKNGKCPCDNKDVTENESPEEDSGENGEE